MKSDASGASPGRMRRDSPQVCCYAEGGPLNPAWVEWLMCWPIGWTDLAPFDPAHFEAWTHQNAPQAASEPDPLFAVDPATLDPHAPAYVPRMALDKVPNRAKRIEALGNGQVPRAVVQAWHVFTEAAAANDDTAADDAPRLAAGGAIVNPKQREARVMHADRIRARALHDLLRAREALDLIRALAETPARDPAAALQSIARLARAALSGATPPDPSFFHGEDHKGDTP
jgi:hypothetical protein